jgi:PKD repeat protein/Mg-chelatase subunit ChlD
MRTTTSAARGRPLAVLLLLFVVLAAGSLVAVAEGTIAAFQTVDPAEIYVAGMGQSPQIATLTLTLQGQGATDSYPVDCLIVMDTSATADLAVSKQFAIDLIKSLGPNDRVGLISFASTARVDQQLTKTKSQAITAVGNLVNGDKSALGPALQLARRELTQTGRDDAVLVLVLLADGQSNVGAEPTVEGTVAGVSGIQITAVGIGTLINRTLLEGLADASGGLFFPRPTQQALAAIADHLRTTTAGSEIQVSKRIPAGLRVVGSTPNATSLKTESDGTTTAVWKIAEMALGQELKIQVRLEATDKGSLSTDEGSTLSYLDFRGEEREVPIAGTQIAVVMPNRAPTAEFAIEPESPTTADVISFEDLSSDIDEDGSVAAWAWSFGDGATSDQASPEHRFSAKGTYTVTLVVTDDRGMVSKPFEMEIDIGNGKPFAGFVLRDAETLDTISQPRVGVETLFDAGSSYDLDGRIESYAWDFDSDGTVDVESDTPETTYAFATPGAHNVSLTVTDDLGGKTTVKKSVTAVSSATAVRSIETCMPGDRTIAGGTVTVTLTITANTTLNGLAVSETYPSGWTFTSVETDNARFRTTGTTTEWLFLERFDDDAVDTTRVIQYTLTAPPGMPTDESTALTIHGYVGSSSPRISQTITGEDKITLVKYLTVPEVISRWNTQTSSIDLCMRELIAFDQIQYAVSLWLDGSVVPQTNNQTIDLGTMQDLIAYWLTASSVHDPLP